MKLRTVFVSEQKQVSIPEGWKIDTTNIVTPPRGKPQYAVLLKRDDTPTSAPIGFKIK